MTVFIERFFIPLLVFILGNGLLLGNAMEFRWATRIIGIIVVSVLAVIVAVFSGKYADSRRASGSTLLRYYGRSTPPSTEDRAYVRITPRALIKIFRSTTEVRAKAEVHVYLDNWLRVSGRIFQMNEYKHYETGEITYLTVTFSSNFPYLSVFMKFHSKWRDRLVVLSRGHRLTVDGRIDNVDLANVYLQDCEIVDL
jgi:hypothetical protein